MRPARILTGGVVALILLPLHPTSRRNEQVHMISHRFMNPLITMSDGLTCPSRMEDLKQAFKRNHRIELPM